MSRTTVKKALSLIMFVAILLGALPPIAVRGQTDGTTDNTAAVTQAQPDAESSYTMSAASSAEEFVSDFAADLNTTPAETMGETPEVHEPAQDPSSYRDGFSRDGRLETAVADRLKDGESVDVIIRLKASSDPGTIAQSARSFRSRSDRTTHVVNQLKQSSEQSQRAFRSVLNTLKRRHLARNVEPYWIFSGYSATLESYEALEILLNSGMVERISEDKVLEAPDEEMVVSEPNLPTWGLENIFATDIWGEYGVKGQGIVVGIMDSGVQGTHDTLRHNYRGRNGNAEASWIDVSGDDYAVPTDGLGHGTHVAGTICGGGEGLPVGVAPKAEWIAAKIFNDIGRATVSGIHRAFEWFLAPGGDPANAPHVVNNSWGNANTYSTEFADDVAAWKAAGIFPCFAAGNEGPGPGTVGSPASFPITFSVGATDIENRIAYFSSRGPAYWPDEQGVQVPYIKPAVCAPGVNILSAYPSLAGETALYAYSNGTSMATPHVTGTIALMLSANPELTIDEVADILIETAHTEKYMGELPNNTYGNGIINAYQAVTIAAYAGEVKGTLTDQDNHPIPGTITIESENITVDVPASGEFSFKVREGTHEAEIKSFGYFTKTESFSIKQDEVVNVAWQLQKSPEYTLSGRIMFSDETPVPHAFLLVTDTPLPIGRSDADGYYAIPDMPEDTYSITVSGSGFKPKTIDVVMDADKELDIVVEPFSFEASPDWPTANNNVHRNSVTDEVIAPETLALDWTYPTPAGMIFASPAIADGIVVNCISSGEIVALDLETGEKRWDVLTGSSNRCSPTIANGTVYAGSGTNREILALDLYTGMTKWKFELEDTPMYVSPLYHEGVLYVASSWFNDAELIAIDAATGEELWREVIGNIIAFGGAIGQNKIYLGTLNDRRLTARSLKDGSEIWTFQHESQGFSARPVFAGNAVYAVTSDFTNGELYAFDAASGDVLWKVDDIGDTQAISPIVYADLVIVGSANNPVLRAFDRQTGKEVWRTREVGTMVANGAVTGNGILYVADEFGNLVAIDAQTGLVLNTHELTGRTNAGISIVAGKVIVAAQKAFNVFSSGGTLSGRVTDAEGNGLAADLMILETDKVVTANDDGTYFMAVNPGTYTVRAALYGYKQQEVTLSFSSGYDLTQDFTLEPGAEGSLSGRVKDAVSGDPVAGVTLALDGTSLETVTDETGAYAFDAVTEGTYRLTASRDGYRTAEQDVVISADKQTKADFELTKFVVAVIKDHESKITKFLNLKGVPAEERDWDVIDSIADYEIIYLNGSFGTYGGRPKEPQLTALIDAAREQHVNIIFADQGYVSYGTIGLLKDFYNDPKYREYTDLFSDRNVPVTLRVDVEHPIFGDAAVGDEIDVMRGSFAWFNRYSGRSLASIGSRNHRYPGSGIGYKAVTYDSAHLLLSAFTASPWNSPTSTWFDGGYDILLNSIDFLRNATYGGVKGVVRNSEGPLAGARVEVVETGYSAETGEDGSFAFFHDPGTYTLHVTAAGHKSADETVVVKVNEDATVDILLSPSEGSTIRGVVYNQVTEAALSGATVTLYDKDGNAVQETESSQAGYYELDAIDEGSYVMKVVLDGFVYYKKAFTFDAATDVGHDVFLYPAPRVGIVTSSSSSELTKILADYGITADAKSLPRWVYYREMEDYDLLIVNDESSGAMGNYRKFFPYADELGMSVIFLDNYSSRSTGIYQLVDKRNDPKIRERVNDRKHPLAYEILVENPIFGDAKAGDVVPIATAKGARSTYFDQYSGYPLANIKHITDGDTPVGLGVAFKPRTRTSMELLMAGHGLNTIYRKAETLTDEARDMLVEAVIWATYHEFPVIEGTVSDTAGNPLSASVRIIEKDKTVETDPENGHFEYADLDGDFTIEVSAFGYVTQTLNVTLDADFEPLDIKLELRDDVGAVEGYVTDDFNQDAVRATLEIVGYPRATVAAQNGTYRLEALEPGTYQIKAEAEGYLQTFVECEIKAGETTELNFAMRPSPTVGIIVDAKYGTKLKDWLGERGWNTVDMLFTDLDMLGRVDIVFANSDFDNSQIPTEEEFKLFLKELDRQHVPVIWTGADGGRGSIRYLHDYLGDPAITSTDSSKEDLTIRKIVDHPIFEGVADEFLFDMGSYYTFDGYSGKTIATLHRPTDESLGGVVAYNGRTLKSVEVLLGGFTFGYKFSPAEKGFTDNHGRIVLNALKWALDLDEPQTGELHGIVMSSAGRAIEGRVKVTETGRTYETEPDGTFFIAGDTGTYHLEISAFGHETKTFEVDFTRGKSVTADFVLMAEENGTIDGKITAAESGEAIKGAQIEVVGTPLRATSDEAGNYEVQVPIGTYTVRVTASGYSPKTVADIPVKSGETTTIDVGLSVSTKIAVMAGSTSYRNKIIALLEEEGYEADGYADKAADGEALLAAMDEYALVFFNDISTSIKDDLMQAMIDKADAGGVSLIFASQWGQNPITRLSRLTQDPKETKQGSEPNYISYKLLKPHPIFEGFEVGDEIKLLDYGKYQQQYATFTGYSGELIADVYDAAGNNLGGGIAYRFPTSDSVHLLLGSLKACSYTQQDRWTENTRQIIVNAIDWAINASLGSITGTVTDGEGNPLPNVTVSIRSENKTVTTDEKGQYTIGVGLGDFEVTASAKGYGTATATVSVRTLGESVVQDFTLTPTERAEIYGRVYDLSTDENLAGAALTLVSALDGTTYEATTDAQGHYSIGEAYAGHYELKVNAAGYREASVSLDLAEGEKLEKNFGLSSYDTAILGDFKGKLAELLLKHEITAEGRDWSILDDLYNYSLVIVNTPDGTDEQMKELLAKADEFEVSLVFVDTWGVGTGSIQLLENVLGYPQKHEHGYDEGAIYLIPTEAHEIFEGYPAGEPIKVHTETSYYSTFENYPGLVLANLAEEENVKGTAIAYDFKGKEHMHMLLSSFAVNNKIGPGYGWTEEGEDLFIRAITWAKDAVQEAPSKPIWLEDEIVTVDPAVTVKGTADYRCEVEIYVDGELVATVEPDEDGNFSADLDLPTGKSYEVKAVAKNYAGETESDVMTVLSVAPPVITEPADGTLTDNDSVTVKGEVMYDGIVTLYVNGVAVADVPAKDLAFGAAVSLEQGENVITATLTIEGVGTTPLSEPITVIRDSEEPQIWDVQPDKDKIVTGGENVSVSFRTNKTGGSAEFYVALPEGGDAPGNADVSLMSVPNMVESEPGYYKGTWTVPSGMSFKNAVVKFDFTDAAGNRIKFDAPGKLSTAEAPPVSTDPSEPTEPTEPSEPTEPTEPSEPTKPTEPSEPTKPTEPSEPTKPTEPSEPTKPTEPVEPTKPTEPSEPTTPTEPVEPTTPTEPVEPPAPTKPVEPTDPPKPSKPVKPTEPPTKPTDPPAPPAPTDGPDVPGTPQTGETGTVLWFAGGVGLLLIGAAILLLKRRFER